MFLPRLLVPLASDANRSCCQPTLSRYSDRHDHVTRAAISQHSHKLDAWQCRTQEEHRQHRDNKLKWWPCIALDRLQWNEELWVSINWFKNYLWHSPVSQIWALIVLLSTTMLRVANSTPIVDFDSRLNSLRVKRDSRLLLPTPESPIRTTATI